MMIKTECQILEKKEKCVTTVLKQFRVQNFHFKRQETAKKIGLENGKKARIFETCNFCFTKNKIYLFWKLLNFWIFFDDNSIVLSEEKTKKGRNGEREELNVNYLYLLENRQRAIAQYDPGILLSLPFFFWCSSVFSVSFSIFEPGWIAPIGLSENGFIDPRIWEHQKAMTFYTK